MPNLKIPISIVVFLLAIGAIAVNSQIYRGVGKPVMEAYGVATHISKEGQILRILSAHDTGGIRMTFLITEKTRFLRSVSDYEKPNPINLEDIRIGEKVTVAYRLREEQLIASNVLVGVTTP